MSEAEWLASSHKMLMLSFLRERASERKLRLAGCAYCRLAWPLLAKASRRAVLLGEEMADGPVGGEHLDSVVRAAIQSLFRFSESRGERYLAADIAYRVLLNDGWYAVEWTMGNWTHVPGGEHILRDIFGNPFRPVAFDPAWRTSTAVAIAEGVYAERAFDRLPILADALQDAGCENADLLGHLRGDGPHVRGCWALDLVLGKE